MLNVYVIQSGCDRSVASCQLTVMCDGGCGSQSQTSRSTWQSSTWLSAVEQPVDVDC